MDFLSLGQQLADYMLALDGFRVAPEPTGTYEHMGAVVTDAILQAGLNYRTVVTPRVNRVLREYPDARTTSRFLTVLDQNGASIVLNWRHPEKPRRLYALTIFLAASGVETEGDLQAWLLIPENCDALLEIKGIGLKTVDYLKNLVNVPTVAVDRHIRRFIERAGIQCNQYDEIRSIVVCAADLLEVPCSNLDHAIWSYSTNSR